MPRSRLLVLAGVLAFAACGNDVTSSPPQFGGAQGGIINVSTKQAAGTAAFEDAASNTLAYTHFIQAHTIRSRVRILFDSLQGACHADSANTCTVLSSSIMSGDEGNASLELRLAHHGVESMITALARAAEITSRTTNAEDLAAPIADADRRIAMLTDYRNRLEALRARSNDVDALIKVNHELADVQSQLEAVTGEHAHLRQRVDTEVLNITLSSTDDHSLWQPIGAAFGGFGRRFAEGIASAIGGLAFLIPWLVVLAALSLGLRPLWRRWRRGPQT